MHSEIFSGKYHVQREIARGGMGTVYLAVDQTLHREVAIKLPHPHLNSDPKFVRKFLKEAQRMAQMNHENVIRIYEIEEDEGVHFIVMEYFPGQDLRQLLQNKGPLELSLALRIAISVTQGLVYAHKRELIHRDIKPGNVLLDNQYNVKIVDFGIAAALGESSTTMTSTLLGTPEYMSPEQIQGVQLTSSSDLYSLGMVLYEIVTGITPYKGLPYQTILLKLADDSFEPEYVFPTHVPSSLQFLIRGLTKKNPYDRLQDTTVVLETLRGYQHHPDFLLPAGGVIDSHVTQSQKTVVLDSPPSSQQANPGDHKLAHERAVQGSPESHRSSTPPVARSTTADTLSREGNATSGRGASDISESFSEDSPTLEIGDARQPLATSSWMLLSFAVILIVGVSGYLWFRTSFDVPLSVSPVVEEDSADADRLDSDTTVVIDKVRNLIEKMVNLQEKTQNIETQVTSHGLKFGRAAQQLLEQRKQGVSVSRRQSLLPEQRRSREIISQNWQVLVEERASESVGLHEMIERLSTEIETMLKDSVSLPLKSLSPAIQDTVERTRNGLLAAHQSLSTQVTRVANEWQHDVTQMNTTLAFPEAQPSLRKELDEILGEFREAYQRQDLASLEDMTNMSESRARMLRGLFRYWASFTINMGVRLHPPDSATVVVTLENMIDRQGRPISRERERIIGTQTLTIDKQGERWGKLEW
ncbi:MAG: hypothetical protein NPIRA01_08320 [Nitrospirales bacterium]|nr:MAG: hypothetical protein NPIRA01_08320 [Nitrospirales bacterium]